MTIRWEAHGTTDVGRVREHNEDAFLVDEARGIVLLADGMGGHAAGEVASGLATETVYGMLARARDAGIEEFRDVLEDSFAAARDSLAAGAARDPRQAGMGTTLLAGVLDAAGHFRMAHIGDSRAYRLHNGGFEQLTRDHTWVQEEVQAGRLPAAALRSHPLAHMLTRALGADSGERPDLIQQELHPGDLLLLASDGLTGMVDDEALAEILRREAPLSDLAAELVAAANRGGGRDNITAVLVRILQAPDAAS
ncbi:protein phosphatase 2C domain-containing protein [soil metagenome]